MTQVSVIGAGPNGLSAAIHAAMAGFPVQVFEAEQIPGGAARTLPLTLPGYLHDFGSAVHPMAAGSPFFRSLSLENYGLTWVHPEIPLAHPFDDGSAVVLYRDLAETAPNLGLDSPTWLRLMRPLVNHWWDFTEDALSPMLRFPNQPWLMARFGFNIPREVIEIVNFTSTAVSVTDKPDLLQIGRAAGDPTPTASRSVMFADGWRDTPIYQREELRQGHKIAGPAIVEEAASVTVLNPGQSLSVDAYGNLLLETARGTAS